MLNKIEGINAYIKKTKTPISSEITCKKITLITINTL